MDSLHGCRYGRQYVEIFLKWAMPLLDKQFKHNQPFCQSLLKNLQVNLRDFVFFVGTAHSRFIFKDLTGQSWFSDWT